MSKGILMIMFARSVGGAELQFLELANYLSRKYQVRLLCLGGNGALKNASVSEKLGIRVYSYRSFFSALVSLLKAIAGNMRYPAELIVTTSFIGNVLGYIIGLFLKPRLVSLQTVSVCMRHPIIDRWILRKFDILITGANDIKNYLISHEQEPDRIHIVHNWVDFSKRGVSKGTHQVKSKLGLNGKIVIGCIGRLHPQKGQIYLIRAYATLAEIFPETALLLVGDGNTKKSLINEANQLGVGDKVIFTGTMSGKSYNNVLNMIDIYIQPSVFEGLPRTLLDAMYMGKPIIATGINGNKEAIRHESNGLLVPSKDSESIVAAVTRFIGHPDYMENLSRVAKNDAVNSFGMVNQMKKIEVLLFN